jgi:uncharacterized protein YdaU (DUF1376 family)
MTKSPAFQFYPGDWLSSLRVSLMTLEEEGAYIRLLCYCWKHGDLPASPEELARLIGKGATPELASKLLDMFESKGGSRVVHERLDFLKAEREAWIEKSRQGGIKSAEKRKKLKENANSIKHPSKGGSRVVGTVVEDCLQPKGNTSSLSSNNSSHSFAEDPSLDEVLAYAGTIGLVEWRAKDWWLKMEAEGWMSGKYGSRITNWQAGLTRIKMYWEADGKPMQRPGTAIADSGETPKMPIWKRIQVLLEEIETHPGNSESTFYKGGEENKKAFKALKRKLAELKTQERMAAAN